MSGNNRQRPRSARQDVSEVSQHGAIEEEHWSQEEAERFFKAFQKYGTDWPRVAGQLKTKTAEACEALHKKFKSLLSLPKPLLNVTAFLAVVKDSLKLESSEAETVSDELQGSASSNALDSDDNNDAIKGEADDAAEDTKPVRRSKRAPQRKYADEPSDAPTWTVRRPRARREPPLARSRRGTPPAHQDLADGMDALLRLADVAQNAQMQQAEGAATEEPASPPLKRSRRQVDKDQQEEEPLTSPSSQTRRRRRTTQVKRRADAQLQKTPNSAAKRAPAIAETSQASSQNEEEEEGDADGDERIVRGKRLQESDDQTGLRHSSRTRRGRDLDEDFILRPQVRRSRKRVQPESDAASEDQQEDQEADLEAEQEDLDEDGFDEAEWSRNRREPLPRKRRRKLGSEKPPPMMARSKAIFARRNVLTIHSPPPAFLIGLPPSAAQPSGIESEGQAKMGETERRLRNCLEPRVRRWAACEFFCSAIDRPWLMRNELTDYLGHVGIPKGTRLARPELAIIRASLGKPRRLSLNYLRQERIKLEAWREEVRSRYSESGPGMDLPREYPPQLQVGQRVVGRHPVTRQLHDGDVLTVTANAYRVQFDRRELGVELIRDIDVMPVDPTVCLPKAVKRAQPEIVCNGRTLGKQNALGMMHHPNTERGLTDANHVPQLPLPAMQSSTAIRSLADMRAALDTRDLLLARQAKMNQEIDAGMHKEEGGQRPAAFQKAYAQVLVDLQMMTKTLESSPFSKQMPSLANATGIPMVNPQAPPPRPDPALLSPVAGVTATSASISPPWDKNSNKVDNWQVALRKAKTLVKRGAQPELYAQPVARLDGDRGQTGRSRGESMDAEETSGKPAVDRPLPLSYSTGSEDSHESDSETSSKPEVSRGYKLVRACIGLVVLLLNSSSQVNRLADVNHAIGQALQILKPQKDSAKPFLNEIKESVAMLTSKLNLHIDYSS